MTYRIYAYNLRTERIVAQTYTDSSQEVKATMRGLVAGARAFQQTVVGLAYNETTDQLVGTELLSGTPWPTQSGFLDHYHSHRRAGTQRRPNGRLEPHVVRDFLKYAVADYASCTDAAGGFRLGEVAYDQHGEPGIILAFYDDGTARLNSNGVCGLGRLRKCPESVGRKAVEGMTIMRPDLTKRTTEAGRCIENY